MTSRDQDVKIEDRSIELGAASVEISAIGPASVKAILARYRDTGGVELAIERIQEDGTATDARPWTRQYANRWLRYAGKVASAIAVAALLAPAAAGAAVETHRHAAVVTAKQTLAPGLGGAHTVARVRSAPCRQDGGRWRRCPLRVAGPELVCRVAYRVRDEGDSWTLYLVRLDCSRRDHDE